MSTVHTPISGAVAVYGGPDTLRLPVIGLDSADHALILSPDGRIVQATKARPGGRNFDRIEASS